MTEREAFVDAGQLAAHLGVSLKTIHNWNSAGRLPAHYLPGSSRPRFRISEVERRMPCRRPRRKAAGA